MTTDRSRATIQRCRVLLGELFDYLDDELTPARCRAIERHIAACACCGTLADNLRTAMAACAAEGRRTLPASVRARARRRITALLASPSGKPRT